MEAGYYLESHVSRFTNRVQIHAVLRKPCPANSQSIPYRLEDQEHNQFSKLVQAANYVLEMYSTVIVPSAR